MPRIKRYWPCSHGFNRDPEIQQLRREYADWMGYVWAEMCAIGDLNEGIVKGDPTEIGASLAYISLTKRPSLAAKCITNALSFMEKRGWIVVETDRVLIVNHLEYHNSRNTKKVPPNDRTTNQPTNKDNKKRLPAPTIILPDWIPSDAWDEFLAVRKRKRAPITPRIADRIIKVLSDLRGFGHDPAEVLHRAVDRNWTSIEFDWIEGPNKRPNGFSKTDDLRRRTEAALNLKLEKND